MFVSLWLFYTIATVFPLHHGSGMMKRREGDIPSIHIYPTQRIFNLPQHIGIVWKELAFDDAVIYTQMDCSTAKCYSCYHDSYPCLLGHLPRALTNWATSPPWGICVDTERWLYQKESLFCLMTPVERIDFYIIDYWTSSIWSLWLISLE